MSETRITFSTVNALIPDLGAVTIEGRTATFEDFPDLEIRFPENPDMCCLYDVNDLSASFADFEDPGTVDNVVNVVNLHRWI